MEVMVGFILPDHWQFRGKQRQLLAFTLDHMWCSRYSTSWITVFFLLFSCKICIILYYITTHRYSYFGQPFALHIMDLPLKCEYQQCHNMSKTNASIPVFWLTFKLVSPLSCSYLLFVKRECFCSSLPKKKEDEAVNSSKGKLPMGADKVKKTNVTKKKRHTWSLQLSCVTHCIEKAVWHSLSMCWEVMDRTWPPPAPIAPC